MQSKIDNVLSPIRLGVDTGGTFTDFALYSEGSLQTHKVLSTPNSPEKAILQGIADLGLTQACAEGKLLVIHGTTVATNAALEGKGAKTLFITNSGLEDILTIGRQNRQDIYQLLPEKPKPPVAPELCLGVDGRIDKEGKEIESLSDSCIQSLVAEIQSKSPEAVAICLIFSYLNPKHEESISRAIANSGKDSFFVSASNEVLPQIGEYERGIATWLNASLGPLMQSYLGRLEIAIPANCLSVMQSSCGTISCRQASKRAVNLLLSGPAGGLAAALSIKKELGCEALLTFDMGGTSSDVALIKDSIGLTSEGKIGRYPVAVPMVDMHTIGAGGGSIAYLDDAGMLHVGPESAGAQPGPACYGLGGTQATVTDAHMLLGNIQEGIFADSKIILSKEASIQAIKPLADNAQVSLEEMALGILELANEHMARALRKISVQRGEDPKSFRLCSFGGAGGLHVCALAEKLDMTKALIPMNCGILSALGMLVAPGKRELAEVIRPEQSKFEILFRQADKLEAEGKAELLSEGYEETRISTSFSLDCRYTGQSFSLQIPFNRDCTQQSTIDAFNAAHRASFGYVLTREVELVSLRAHLEAFNDEIPETKLRTDPQNQEAKAIRRSSIYAQSSDQGRNHDRYIDTPIYRRDTLVSGQKITGPALIAETSSTSWIGRGWTARVSGAGHLLLDREISDSS